MRGGAIPLVAWGTILLVLYIVHAIWNGRTVPTIATGFAVLAIYGFGACVWILGRDTLRRGPPADRAVVGRQHRGSEPVSGELGYDPIRHSRVLSWSFGARRVSSRSGLPGRRRSPPRPL